MLKHQCIEEEKNAFKIISSLQWKYTQYTIIGNKRAGWRAIEMREKENYEANKTELLLSPMLYDYDALLPFE